MQIFSIRQFLIESLDLGETEYRSNESKRSILSHVNFGRFMPIQYNNITKHDFVGIPVYESVSLNSYGINMILKIFHRITGNMNLIY